MLKVILKFGVNGEKPLEIDLFQVDVAVHLKKELEDAVYAEVNYNGMMYDLGGFIKGDY